MKPKAPAGPATTISATVKLRRDGQVWFPLQAVADVLGGTPEYVLNRAQHHKVPIAADPDAVPDAFKATDDHGFESAAAADLIFKVTAERAEHDRKWANYQAYLEDQKRLAREKRDAEMAAAREAERKHQKRMFRQMEETAAREAQQAAALKAAERAEREGQVVPFEKWKAS